MIPSIHPLTRYCERHSWGREFRVVNVNQPVQHYTRGFSCSSFVTFSNKPKLAFMGLCDTNRHHVTLSPCHLVTMSPCHLVTTSPCHLVTMSPCHHVTTSPCHLVTMSPCHHVIVLGTPPTARPAVDSTSIAITVLPFFHRGRQRLTN